MNLLRLSAGFAILAVGAALLVPGNGTAQMTTGEYGSTIGATSGAPDGGGSKMGETAITGTHIEGLNRAPSCRLQNGAAHDTGNTVIQEIPLDEDAQRGNYNADWRPMKAR